jgi:hypothetical protein
MVLNSVYVKRDASFFGRDLDSISFAKCRIADIPALHQATFVRSGPKKQDIVRRQLCLRLRMKREKS